jgi:hypothetical protein
VVTNGDVFAVVATLTGVCVSAWALILGVAQLFTQRALLAREQLTGAPWRSFLLGFVAFLVLGLFSLVLLKQPLPLGKLIGWTVLLGTLSVAATGAAGMVALASQRLRAMAPEMTPYAAFSKSAAVIVVAGLVPFLGWFLIVPVVIVFSLGSGMQALFARARQANFQI